MFKEFKNNPYFRFTFFAIILYVVWYIIYEAWLHPYGVWDRIIISNLVFLTNETLSAMGYLTIADTGDPALRIVGVDGTNGVWIGDPCNGFSLFALFVIFMITYPGPWKHKMWFIPFGLLSIHIINVLRIVALAVIASINYEWLDFNHNYTFNVIVYSSVFVLWYIWAKKYAGPFLNSKREQSNVE